MTPIQERLFALQDLSYRAFQSKLMPTVDPSRVIGVRMPALRQLAKEIAAEPQTAAEFLALPEHRYYEEDNLEGLLINGMKDELGIDPYIVACGGLGKNLAISVNHAAGSGLVSGQRVDGSHRHYVFHRSRAEMCGNQTVAVGIRRFGGIGKAYHAQIGTESVQLPERLGEPHIKADTEPYLQTADFEEPRLCSGRKVVAVPAPQALLVIAAHQTAVGCIDHHGVEPFFAVKAYGTHRNMHGVFSCQSGNPVKARGHSLRRDPLDIGFQRGIAAQGAFMKCQKVYALFLGQGCATGNMG